MIDHLVADKKLCLGDVFSSVKIGKLRESYLTLRI